MKLEKMLQVSATFVCLTLIIAATALAQNEPAPGGAWPQQGQDRLIEMFLNHATAELNLTVEQRHGLETVLRETMERRGQLARSQMQLNRQIREALSDPATQDEEFRRLTGEILVTKGREIELLDWQEARLLEVLTPRQTLRFMLLQQQLAQRIEEERRKKRGQ